MRHNFTAESNKKGKYNLTLEEMLKEFYGPNADKYNDNKYMINFVNQGLFYGEYTTNIIEGVVMEQYEVDFGIAFLARYRYNELGFTSLEEFLNHASSIWFENSKGWEKAIETFTQAAAKDAFAEFEHITMEQLEEGILQVAEGSISASSSNEYEKYNTTTIQTDQTNSGDVVTSEHDLPTGIGGSVTPSYATKTVKLTDGKKVNIDDLRTVSDDGSSSNTSTSTDAREANTTKDLFRDLTFKGSNKQAMELANLWVDGYRNIITEMVNRFRELFLYIY